MVSQDLSRRTWGQHPIRKVAPLESSNRTIEKESEFKKHPGISPSEDGGLGAIGLLFRSE